MELAGIEVVFVERCAVRQNVISLGDGLLAEWHIVAMDEIGVGMLQGFSHSCICCIGSVSESLVKLRLQIVYLVPSHSWYLVFVLLRLESLHIHIEDADAIYIAFFRMSAQELLSHANAQYGLLEILDHLVQLVGLEIFHGFPCLPLTWKQYAVCLLEHFCIISEYWFYAQTLHGVDYGIDISGIVFYDCYIHNLT